jgi:hypothetical protein
MTEKEELEAFLTNPVWLRMKQYAEKTWRGELDNHVRAAANDTNDQAALQKIRQIIVAKDAVERLIQWPEERLARVRLEAEPRLVGSRGGYGT